MPLTFGRQAVKLPDDVWKVVLDTLSRFDDIDCDSPELKEYVEQNCDITLFDGGAFIADQNEFDVFVVPEKRGKWAIRREINGFLAKLAQTHNKAIVKINESNVTSLRLAEGFGLDEVAREGPNIILERPLWVA